MKTVKNWMATKNITFQLYNAQETGRRKILLYTTNE
jgi:hypothetical protein